MSWREAFLRQARSENSVRAPRTAHQSLVRLLQVLKGQPYFRRRLGYDDPLVFRSFIDSLLPLAERVERLAPSAAGLTQPNPEYPWKDPMTQVVWAPSEYSFELFDPRDPKMIKLEALLTSLLRASM